MRLQKGEGMRVTGRGLAIIAVETGGLLSRSACTCTNESRKDESFRENAVPESNTKVNILQRSHVCR